MDGSSISLVMSGTTDLQYFVLDRQHARIYWEYDDKEELFVYDIMEGHRPRTVPGFSSPGKVLLYVSGDIFIWLVGSGDLHEVVLNDAAKGTDNFKVLYQLNAKEDYVQIVPQEDHRRSHPCLTMGCSHVCALSGPEGASCLCGRNEGLSLDQVTCAGSSTTETMSI